MRLKPFLAWDQSQICEMARPLQRTWSGDREGSDAPRNVAQKIGRLGFGDRRTAIQSVLLVAFGSESTAIGEGIFELRIALRIRTEVTSTERIFKELDLLFS